MQNWPQIDHVWQGKGCPKMEKCPLSSYVPSLSLILLEFGYTRKRVFLTLFTLAYKTTISSAAVMYPLEVGRISDFDVQNGVVNFRTHHNICCLPKATKDIREDWKSGAAIASSIAHRSQQSSRHFGVPPIHQQHSVALTLEGREWVLNQLRPNLEILVK